MKKLLILAALVASGCDDSEVSDRITSVLLNGAVQAELQCSGITETVMCGTTNRFVKASLLQDGATLVEYAWSAQYSTDARMSGTSLMRRGEPVELQLQATLQSVGISIADGFVVFGLGPSVCGGSYGYPYPEPDSIDISEECSGFNLEAFE